MDDTLLLDAIERYRNGEMSGQEITFFEELRKNNPEIDQLAAEHNFFLGELEKMSEIKAYRHNLNEVENKLTNEGIISRKEAKGKQKLFIYGISTAVLLQLLPALQVLFLFQPQRLFLFILKRKKRQR